MDEILVEIYLPASRQTFDVLLPLFEKIADIQNVVKSLLTDLSLGLFNESIDSVLCFYETGEVLSVNKTPWELGLKNGERLLLI